jgi:signal transduction histidine kinase
MKELSKIILFGLIALALTSTLAFAGDREDAISMVKSAVEYYNANGLEKALDAFNDIKGPFSKGELYVIAFTFDGTLVANAPKQNLVGQNLLEVPDSNGKKFRKEIVELAKANKTGWVDYMTQNPRTKAMEPKTTYVERAGELAIGCGVYKK